MRPAALSLILAASALSAAPVRGDGPMKVPDKAQLVLARAAAVEVWSLEPVREKDPDKESFHGWKVLGKTTVKGDARKTLADALAKGLAEQVDGARCFIPRHGLRAVHEGVQVDLVICFECSWIHVYMDKAEKPDAVVTVAKLVQPAFDKVLKDAHVPLPKD